MKKVRFEALETSKMNDSECHSPRPFLETRASVENTALCYNYSKPITFSMDPVHRFETSNSSPYPLSNRTNLDHSVSAGYNKWSPSSDLELSMLDATCHEPRRPPAVKPMVFQPNLPTLPLQTNKESKPQENNVPERVQKTVLTSIENTKNNSPSNNLHPENSFFITKGNLRKFQIQQSVSNLHRQFNMLSLDKENNPESRKQVMMTMATQDMSPSTESTRSSVLNPSPRIQDTSDCSCHHCIQTVQAVCRVQMNKDHYEHKLHTDHVCNHMKPLPTSCNCYQCIHRPFQQREPSCYAPPNSCDAKPQNTLDKKTWAIEKYEQSKNSSSTEVQKQTGIKEKREPTVADLFKIIKLQNEQLQLLQEKVDKFISANNNSPPSIPIQSYTTEYVALETVNSEQHKISIGVMTSFEMVRTSTVINKEVLKQTENSQIQCNRSQISIKEVVSKSQPLNMNFLDGIAPVGNNLKMQDNNVKSKVPNGNYEEKTLNELSLYNVQVDNATTPLMSPEQTLYLDVRDYSDSDPGSDDQSNVGWTYYNKVMTHVNGMLQDSDMPSSASALYRNTRQQCLQMQIDKTNVSVTKRVKFGDDPLGIHQPHIYAATTDTSMKMNQLAAKYLKNMPAPAPQPPLPPPPVAAKTTTPYDMSFATRNYMERHKLLQGVPGFPKEPESTGIPRFLDITALKQQPKLL